MEILTFLTILDQGENILAVSRGIILNYIYLAQKVMNITKNALTENHRECKLYWTRRRYNFETALKIYAFSRDIPRADELTKSNRNRSIEWILMALKNNKIVLFHLKNMFFLIFVLIISQHYLTWNWLNF